MKMDIRNFFKNNVVSSSEVRVNDDIRKTHTAENNAAQVTGINNETGDCSAAMATTKAFYNYRPGSTKRFYK